VGGTPGTDFDQLNVAGNAAFGGVLNVTLATGFTPATGNSFVITTYGSQTGLFSSIFSRPGLTGM
jgi:hypothetical protein